MKKGKKLFLYSIIALTILSTSVVQAVKSDWFFNVRIGGGTQYNTNWNKNDNEQKAYISVIKNMSKDTPDNFGNGGYALGVRIRDLSNNKMTSYHVIRGYSYIYGTYAYSYDQGRMAIKDFPYNLHGQVDSSAAVACPSIFVGGRWDS